MRRGGHRPLKNEFRRVHARLRGRQDGMEHVREDRDWEQRKQQSTEQTREGNKGITWGGQSVRRRDYRRR